jgi:hypothetical protein
MNEKLIIIGGGSSIGNFDLHLLDNHVTFGLNFVCHFYEPTAVVWVDRDFFQNNSKQILNNKALKITKKVLSVPDDFITLKTSKQYNPNGFKDGMYSPYLVGLFALSVGIALQFKEIYLLGYDGRFINNKSHFHDIEHRGKQNEKAYLKGNAYYEVYKNSLSKIYNVSLESAIHTFEKISYKEFIEKININHKLIQQTNARKWLIDEIRRH